MKISEMTNDQATEALIRLSVPFGNICDDDKITEMIDKYNNSKDMPLIRTVGKLLPEFIAYAMKTHRDDLYEIVGALTDKKTEQVAKMNFFETIKVIRDSYDEVLKDFFTSSVGQMKKTEEES